MKKLIDMGEFSLMLNRGLELEARANARLIAAAPDLLALAYNIAAMDPDTPDDELRQSRHKCIAMARKAIKKAAL